MTGTDAGEASGLGTTRVAAETDSRSGAGLAGASPGLIWQQWVAAGSLGAIVRPWLAASVSAHASTAHSQAEG